MVTSVSLTCHIQLVKFLFAFAANLFLTIKFRHDNLKLLFIEAVIGRSK
jgi:hypothetical protein